MTDAAPTVNLHVEFERPADFRRVTIGIGLGIGLDDARAQLPAQLGERSGEVASAAVDTRPACSTPPRASGCWKTS
ncbi:hypothetical protein [Streptacidiphilus melanogenes]|uniref:hypothetical protein n=1 Tax=Streptacidiphilus melanogenes TaxID=411235 RepID=UPI0005A7A912|nr:hypothetical protein [Streptacidiphilus melanogenes]